MTPSGKSSTPTSVYRYYDEHGWLIYVGITGVGIGRNVAHSQRSLSWWSFVATQDVEHYASQEEAHSQEIALIQKFRPPFNRTHNPEWRTLRPEYLYARELNIANIRTKGQLPTEATIVPLDVISLDLDAGRGKVRTRYASFDAVERIVFTKPRPTVKLPGGFNAGGVKAFERHGPLAYLDVAFCNGAVLRESFLKLRALTSKVDGRVQYDIKFLMTTIQPSKTPRTMEDEIGAEVGRVWTNMRFLSR